MQNKKTSILIVDDELSIRNGLSKAIQWEDYNVVVLGTAQDGLEALEFIKQNKPDIVISDIKMPKLDGLGLIQNVNALKLHTKFIIISGYDDFKYAQMAIKYGVKSYLLKPIKKSELINEVEIIAQELQLSANSTGFNIEESNNLAISNHSQMSKFLSGLLLNEYRQKDEILQNMQKFNFSLKDTSLQVVIFNYEFLAFTDEKTKKSANTILKAQLKQNIEETLKGTSFVVFEYNSNNVICILNSDSLESKNIYSVRDFCSSCITSVKSSSGLAEINLYAGIGDTVGSLLMTGESYKIALEALSYKIYETEQCIFDSSVISKNGIYNQSASSMDNSALIDAIYCGNREEMQRLVKAAFGTFISNASPPPNFIRGMFIYMVIDVQKGLSVYLDKNSELFTEKPYIVINQLPFISQIIDWIIELFTDYISLVKENCTYKKDPIIEKAKAFINENIYKKIKVEAISENVNLSTNYFTAYFKQKTNVNISDYVINLKIEHAKNLLKTTSKSINEISFLLGYEDYRSFNRVFKKIVGKTPTDFRQVYNNPN